jgi:hypothetical protein
MRRREADVDAGGAIRAQSCPTWRNDDEVLDDACPWPLPSLPLQRLLRSLQHRSP